MRGDSLRDLYAKTLALIGLVLLGAVGALVDYWPVRQEVPAAAGGLRAPGAARPIPAADAMIPDMKARDRGMAPLLASAAPRATAPAPVVPPADSLRVSAASPRAVASGTATPPALGVPPAPPLLLAVDAPAVFHARPVAELALAAPPPAASLPVSDAAPSGLPAIVLSESPVPADDGFLADATSMMKKTGATIVTGTMKAGAPFVGVARFLGDAFRKITPFKN